MDEKKKRDSPSQVAFDLDLEREVENASRALEILGLTGYEARAYMALVAHGHAPADAVAQTARIPRTSCYKALESLVEKGLAYSLGGRPRLYKAEDPNVVRRMAQKRLDETFDRLSMVHEILSEKGLPQLVYTIVGKDRVFEKIRELLDESQKRFIISTPLLSEIRKNLRKEIENALRRGVDLVVITEPGQKTPAGVKVFRRKGLIATDIISDGTRALLASPDLNACGYTDNPALAQHLERFLEIMMEKPV